MVWLLCSEELQHSYGAHFILAARELVLKTLAAVAGLVMSTTGMRPEDVGGAPGAGVPTPNVRLVTAVTAHASSSTLGAEPGSSTDSALAAALALAPLAIAAAPLTIAIGGGEAPLT